MYDYVVQSGGIPQGPLICRRLNKRKKKPLNIDELNLSHLSTEKAARELGMCSKTLYKRLEEHNIKKRFRSLDRPLETRRGGLFDSYFIISPATPQELPPDWEELEDAVSGRIYYANHKGHTTTWERPCLVIPSMPYFYATFCTTSMPYFYATFCTTVCLEDAPVDADTSLRASMVLTMPETHCRWNQGRLPR